MIKAVIFDYGGVTGKEPNENETCLAIAKRCGLGYDFVKSKYNLFEAQFVTNGISKKEFYARLAHSLGVSAKDVGPVWDVKYFQQKPKLNRKVVKIAGTLKSSGYKLALLSNVFPHRDTILKKHGCYKFFPNIILSSKVRLKKPDKKIYEYAIEKLKVKANECLFVDDREKNINGAKKVGMRAILFKNADQLEKDLKRYL
ncbi:MAG: HAD family phosphatase [Candidatus Aenigmatarchaeota archaeon]